MPEAPARRFWHQGFGVIHEGYVPFVSEETCRRIAAQAAAAGFPTGVLLRDGLWCFVHNPQASPEEES